MSDELLEDLYQELLLDHFKHPRNFGVLKQTPDQCQVKCTVHNPLCGDQVHLSLAAGEDGRPYHSGCCLRWTRLLYLSSIASMMTELCKVRPFPKQGICLQYSAICLVGNAKRRTVQSWAMPWREEYASLVRASNARILPGRHWINV